MDRKILWQWKKQYPILVAAIINEDFAVRIMDRRSLITLCHLVKWVWSRLHGIGWSVFLSQDKSSIYWPKDQNDCSLLCWWYAEAIYKKRYSQIVSRMTKEYDIAPRLCYISHHHIYTASPERKGVSLITHQEWMPKSPGTTPSDNIIWGIFMRHLHKHKVQTFSGLNATLKRSGGTCLSWP